MIQAVTSARFPDLSIHVWIGDRDHPDHELDVEPLVDTGFDGGLAVPQALIPSIVPSVGESVWYLADGTEIKTRSYFCYVSIGHLQAVPTAVIALDGDMLLGRHVTDQFRVTFDHGQQIIVEA
jgi:predicted aspartyl protease